jgi:LysR family transcriptional activator of nhaA
MDWLNYHHLMYFWTMAREGSVSKAAEKLHLSQPTISGQLRQLELAIGTKLYERVGRDLRLTETGKLVFEYAEEIFSTGQELVQRLKGNQLSRKLPFVVGVPDFVPKLIAYRLIEPIFRMNEQVQLTCYEGKLSELLSDLAMHRLDLVISDSPAGSQVSVKAYNHPLGECGVCWVAVKPRADELSAGYPQSLNGQPLLLPTQNTVLRRSIEQWLLKQDIEPNIVAEIEDSALLKILAAQGIGAAPVAVPVLKDVALQYGLHSVGIMDGVSMQFVAISAERKVTHPAVKLISEEASLRLLRPTRIDASPAHADETDP